MTKPVSSPNTSPKPNEVSVAPTCNPPCLMKSVTAKKRLGGGLYWPTWASKGSV